MAAKYYSTRSSEKAVSFEHAVIEGLAPDGGLYLPEKVCAAPPDWVSKWRSLSFAELAVEIFKLYISPSEIPVEDLEKLVEKSYKTFRSEEVTPLYTLNSKRRLYLLELFHGPTYAFKDVALQLVGNLFEYFLHKRNEGKATSAPDRERITVVGATSGDTGSAAIYGLRNKKDVSVFILYPTGRISAIQEQQMTSVMDPNVHTISVPGTFDDCQDLVKQMFGDRKFNAKYHLGAVNSINWARILAQITYYFKSYFALLERLGWTRGQPLPRVKYSVPTGNFGDILAGYYAREMGLNIELLIATNANDILYRFLNSGSYAKEGEVHTTLSPAMDIVVSSNFERFLWHAARHTIASTNVDAGKLVKSWMEELKNKGSFTVPDEVHQYARSIFTAQRSNDAQTKATISEVYREISKNYILDPHSAVGVSAALAEMASDADTKKIYVVLATAHPAKFADAVNDSLQGISGYSFEADVLPNEFKIMMKSETKKIFASTTSKDEIEQIIADRLAA